MEINLEQELSDLKKIFWFLSGYFTVSFTAVRYTNSSEAILVEVYSADVRDFLCGECSFADYIAWKDQKWILYRNFR